MKFRGLSALMFSGLMISVPPVFADALMRGDGPAPQPKPFHIEKADPALNDIVAPDARLELLGDGFGLTEGPVWIRDGKNGYLLVSSLIDNVIYKITPEKEVSVYLEYAGYSGDSPENVGTQTRSGRSHVLLIGPTCAGLDNEGRLLWCAMQDFAIKRQEKDGTITTVADNYEGKHFSGPNDIAVRSDGAIFFTDSDYGLRGAGNSPLKEIANGVWLIKDGKITRLLMRSALGGPPNGIALSPDEKYLYLSADSKLMRYEVRSNDTLANPTLFNEGAGIGDGIKVDKKGNVYSTSGAGPGIIRIVSPGGKYLGALHLPIIGKEPKRQICATNLAFGENDGKALFITACDAVYKIRLKVEGMMPGQGR